MQKDVDSISYINSVIDGECLWQDIVYNDIVIGSYCEPKNSSPFCQKLVPNNKDNREINHSESRYKDFIFIKFNTIDKLIEYYKNLSIKFNKLSTKGDYINYCLVNCAGIKEIDTAIPNASRSYLKDLNCPTSNLTTIYYTTGEVALENIVAKAVIVFKKLL